MTEEKTEKKQAVDTSEESNGKTTISKQKPRKKRAPRKKPAVNKELQKLKEEMESWKEKYLRLAAEFDNFKKRKERESGEFLNLATAGLIKKILPIADDLERSLESARNDQDFDALVQGLELVQKTLVKVLEDEGVTTIPAVGEEFNPEFHDALMIMEKDDIPSNTVIDEHEKGYMLGDRVLRPAKVIVSK